jgi:hypothetical protein
MQPRAPIVSLTGVTRVFSRSDSMTTPEIDVILKQFDKPDETRHFVLCSSLSKLR